MTSFAIVGVSRDTRKFGYKVFSSLKKSGQKVYPINPNAKGHLGGLKCYGSLKELPEKPDVVVTVVPPKIALKAVKEASKLGITEIWMQKGSESEEAIEFCKQKSIYCTTNACIIITNERSYRKDKQKPLAGSADSAGHDYARKHDLNHNSKLILHNPI